MDFIKLGPDNFDAYGFARFCYPGEYEETNDGLVREIRLPDGAQGLKKVKLIFQRSDLVLLSGEPTNKLVDQDCFNMVHLGEDVAAMYLLAQRAGWNQTFEDLKIITRAARTNLLAVAEIDGIPNPLGSGLVLNVGPSLRWIGMILVHPELRRQGVATAVMHKCLKEARSSKPTTVVGLDATPEGLQVYTRLGFMSSFPLWRSRIRTNTEIEKDRALEIRRIESMEDLEAIFRDFDLQMKEEGLKLVHKLHPEGTWMAKSGGETVGLVMTRPGRLMPLVGPLMANSQSTARSLLKQALMYWQGQGFEEVFVDTPETHFSTASLWENEGKRLKPPAGHVLDPELKPERAFIRMYQVITDEVFDRLTEQNTSINKNAGNLTALKSGREARQATFDYMEQEVKTLKHLYASGGPELS